MIQLKERKQKNMDVMSIASVATNMKRTQLQTEAGLKVMKIAMDTTKMEGEQLIEMIDSAITGVGQTYDGVA